VLVQRLALRLGTSNFTCTKQHTKRAVELRVQTVQCEHCGLSEQFTICTYAAACITTRIVNFP